MGRRWSRRVVDMASHAAETLSNSKLRLGIVAETVFVVSNNRFWMSLGRLLVNLLHFSLSDWCISSYVMVSCTACSCCIRAVYCFKLIWEQALIVALVTHFAIRAEWAHSVELLSFAIDNYISVHLRLCRRNPLANASLVVAKLRLVNCDALAARIHGHESFKITIYFDWHVGGNAELRGYTSVPRAILCRGSLSWNPSQHLRFQLNILDSNGRRFSPTFHACSFLWFDLFRWLFKNISTKILDLVCCHLNCLSIALAKRSSGLLVCQLARISKGSRHFGLSGTQTNFGTFVERRTARVRWC